MIETAKRTLKEMIKGQKGQALPIVLILLVIGGLLVIPTLNYTSTSLKGHQVTETKIMELYAADSGVELALWHLMYGGLVVLEGEDLEPFTMNNETVNVNIFSLPDVDTPTYRITSIAGSTIVAHVTNITLHFTGNLNLVHGDRILGNVYVEGNVELHADAEIVGNVIAEGDVILNNDAVMVGDICAGGNVTLNADTVIVGNVYAVGDVTLNARARIVGNVYTSGNVTLSHFAEITGDYPLPYGGCPLFMGGPTIITWEIT